MLATCRRVAGQLSQKVACSEREVPAERICWEVCSWRIYTSQAAVMMRRTRTQCAEHNVKSTLAFTKPKLECALPVALVLDSKLVVGNWMKIGKVKRPDIIFQNKAGDEHMSKTIKVDIAGSDL